MNDDSEERFLSEMTHDSVTDENNQRLALNLSSSPARAQKAFELSETGSDNESEDLNVSPSSLGIDFVWVDSLRYPLIRYWVSELILIYLTSMEFH